MPDAPDAALNTPVARRLLRLLRPHSKRIAFGFTLMLTGAVLGSVTPLFLKHAIDVNLPDRDLTGLLLTAGLFLLAQVLLLGARYTQQIVLEGVGQDVVGDLRQRLFAHALRLPVAYHADHSPGELVSRVESDTEQLRRLFSSAVVMLLGNLLLFAGMFAVMAWVDLALTAVMACVVPLLIALVVWFQRATTHRFLAVRRKTARVAGLLTEWIQGVEVLQAYRREHEACDDLREANLDRFRTQFSVHWRLNLFWNVILLIEGLGLAAVLSVGGYRVAQGVATVGTIVLFMDYLRRTFEPIRQLAHEVTSFQQAFAGARAVFEFLSLPTEPDPPEPATLPAVQDGITFEDVWFAYHDEDWVLRDVSFHVPRGERWALVGATGSGKSTLVGLLLGFFPPTRGRVLLDGVDVRDLTRADLRRLVGYVPQDLYLFPGDVSDNLRLGDLGEDAVRHAVTRLGLDDFINSLPEGWRSEIAEGGANLSAGERQLLCAARALAHDPQVLVLDEATSAVDPHTESKIAAALDALLDGRTTLTVAHRLSTIRASDQILVLHRGEVIERGTHESLRAQGGAYERLAALQFGEEVFA